MVKALLLFLLFISMALFAQGNQPMSMYENTWSEKQAELPPKARHYLQLTMGLALPGNTYSAGTPDQESGYARTGFNGQLSGGYLLSKNVGWGATLGRYTSPISTDAYKQNILFQLPAEDSHVNYIWTQNWQNTIFTTGPFVSIIQQRVLLDLYAQAGVLQSRMPKIVVSGFDSEDNFLHIRQSGLTPSFAFLTGASIGYLLPKFYRLRLMAKADFIGATPMFNRQTDIFTTNLHAQTKGHYSQSVGVFSLSVGLRYEFNAY